jgi:hypothetical protein
VRVEDGAPAAYAAGEVALELPWGCERIDLWLERARARALSSLSRWHHETYDLRERRETEDSGREVHIAVMRGRSELRVEGAQVWSAWFDRAAPALHVLLRVPAPSGELAPSPATVDPPDPIDPRDGQSLGAARAAIHGACAAAPRQVRMVITTTQAACCGARRGSPVVETFRVTASDLGPPMVALAVAHSEAWAVGPGGRIRHWHSGKWRGDEEVTRADLHGVWAGAADAAWAVGDAGTLLRWDGARWRVEASPVRTTLRAVGGIGRRDLWAVGDAGAAMHWDGRRWTTIPTGSSESLLEVYQRTGTRVWARGTGDAVLMYDGQRWDDTLTGFGARWPVERAAGAMGGSPLPPPPHWRAVLELGGARIVDAHGVLALRVPWRVHAVAGDAGKLWVAGEGGVLFAEPQTEPVESPRRVPAVRRALRF